jgi:hypothetical protein
MGVKGNLATTRPSNLCKLNILNIFCVSKKLTNKTHMLLNMLNNAVNAKPMANIDFIFTIDKSRLLILSFSSTRSIFFFCCLSTESP